LFGERLDTLFTSSDKKISGFTRPHVIGFVADIFFSTLESVFIFFRIRCRIRQIRVDGSRIRNEKVADSKISGYVWPWPQSAERGADNAKVLSSTLTRSTIIYFFFYLYVIVKTFYKS